MCDHVLRMMPGEQEAPDERQLLSSPSSPDEGRWRRRQGCQDHLLAGRCPGTTAEVAGACGEPGVAGKEGGAAATPWGAPGCGGVRVPGSCGPVATSASLLRGRPPEGSAGSPLGHTWSPLAGKPALSGIPPPASIGFYSESSCFSSFLARSPGLKALRAQRCPELLCACHLTEPSEQPQEVVTMSSSVL